MAVGNIYELVVRTQMGGVQSNNVFHLADTDGSTDAQALAANWIQEVHPYWTDIACTALQVLAYICRQLHPEAGDAVELAAAGDNQGTVAGDPLPTFCAGLTSQRTGFANRRKRGRFFFMGLAEASVNGNTLIPSAQVALQNIADQIMLNYGPSGTQLWRVGVLSRKTIEETGDWQQAFTPVTTMNTSSTVAVMRRRKLGYGI